VSTIFLKYVAQYMQQNDVPWNPSKQRHVKLLIPSTHVAPFRQGFELHSSISTYKTKAYIMTSQSKEQSAAIAGECYVITFWAEDETTKCNFLGAVEKEVVKSSAEW